MPVDKLLKDSIINLWQHYGNIGNKNHNYMRNTNLLLETRKNNMNIRIFEKKIYKCMQQTNSVVFLIIAIVVSTLAMYLLGMFSDYAFNRIIRGLYGRFILGIPLLLQLFLTYIIYRNNDRKFIKILWWVMLFYTVVCAALALYDLFFTIPDYGEGLLIGLCLSQFIFQAVLFAFMAAAMFFKKVDKQFVIKSLVIFGISFILVFASAKFALSDFTNWGYDVFMIVTLVNCYSPMILFILCSLAKDKVFRTGDITFLNDKEISGLEIKFFDK